MREARAAHGFADSRRQAKELIRKVIFGSSKVLKTPAGVTARDVDRDESFLPDRSKDPEVSDTKVEPQDAPTT
jgi:hypothetical protein